MGSDYYLTLLNHQANLNRANNSTKTGSFYSSYQDSHNIFLLQRFLAEYKKELKEDVLKYVTDNIQLKLDTSELEKTVQKICNEINGL